MYQEATVAQARRRSPRKRTKKAKSSNPGTGTSLRANQNAEMINSKARKTRKASQLNNEENLKSQI